MDRSPQQLIWDNVQKIGVCMLVTSNGSELRSRPMRGMIREEEGAIWFITDSNTEKEHDVVQFPEACLTFADTREMMFVSLSGKMERIDDREKITELWSEAVEAYFPQGKEDPALTLLQFRPENGEFWEAPSSPLVLAIKFLQAKVTAQRPEFGSNEKVAMS